ncbi:MAG: 23S rRNA (adenine(2503)-C(2))-methyltransferase RlmN [Parcubacteria group bacterium]|nr:23S rRNA (adenine(2503)-C(2))-methyltransferase RlmN [Parcubacteria group bacterium]
MQIFPALFPHEPLYRSEQMQKALFEEGIFSWDAVSNLPVGVRRVLTSNIPWLSITLHSLLENSGRDTYKALLQTADNKCFESVLMKNRKGDWTICVSSQIGCAMQCRFCATGTMGLIRNLTEDEIMDQYRFWKHHLAKNSASSGRISNVVFMGMGEPLANYEAVKNAIQIWLKYTDLGVTKITISTVGILSQLEHILHDDEWPQVRIAISLHSADAKKRLSIVPTSAPQFPEKIQDWTHRYAKILGNRRHAVTFEYTLLAGKNDSEEDAMQLVRFMRKTAASKVNLIPYNPVSGKSFTRSDENSIAAYKNVLESAGITATVRKTMGDDISAACGQLVTLRT